MDEAARRLPFSPNRIRSPCRVIVSPFASLRSRLFLVVAAAIAPFVLYAGLSVTQAKTSADSVLRTESLSRAKASAQLFDSRLRTVDIMLDAGFERVQRSGSITAPLAMTDSISSQLARALSIAVIDTGGRRTALLSGADTRIDGIPIDRRTSLVAMAIVNSRLKLDGPSTFVDEGGTRAPSDSIAMIIVRPLPRPRTPCRCLADTPGALVAVLSDASVQSMLGVDSLPDGGVAVLMGSAGLPLGHIVTPGRWIDRDVPDTSVLGSNVAREGVVEMTGLDGERRTVGFAALTRLPWRVYVGLERAKVSAVPDQRLRDALMLALLSLTIASIGVVLASRTFSAPLQTLIADTRRLSAGALSHRTDVAARGGEIGALGIAMNSLATDLEHRRKASQDELRDAMTVFDESPLPMWIADAGTTGAGRDRIHHANAAAARMFGVTSGALVGQRDTELFDAAGAAMLTRELVPPDDGDQLPAHVGRAAVLTPSATHRDCLLSVAHIVSARGQQRIVTVLDAPLKVEPEPATHQLSDRRSVTPTNSVPIPIDPTEADLVAFAGHIADEFTGLLQGLDGFTKLAMDSADDPDMQSVAHERIRVLAKQGLTFARQVRAFSRRDALHVDVIDANETIRALLDDMSDRLGSEVQLDARYNVTPALVRADPELLTQVVSALIANARDAMPDGGTLSIATTMLEIPEEPDVPYAAPPGSYIVLTVADTGVGMTAAEQEHMFEPFWSTKADTGRSVGLALAAATGIASEHGWVLGVDSELGFGTLVSIYMPLNVALRPPASPADVQVSTSDTTPARST